MVRRKGKRRATSELAQRPGRDWAARGALALAFLAMGYVGTTRSLANAVAKVDPVRAHMLAPSNGAILASYAQDAFARQPNRNPDSQAARLAKRAMLADPTAAKALTVLGFQAQLRGEAARANRLFGYSTELTRRELRPRIWAIEEAVTRGDVRGALRHYDIALRTSGDAADMLFPTLTAALSEPRIRSELLKILATRPVWRDSFISYATTSGIEPEGAIALLSMGDQIGLEPTRAQSAYIVNALLARHKRDAAWAYYKSFNPKARRDRSRDPDFTLQVDHPAMFDWRVGGDARLAAAILADEGGGLLDFSVPPSASGVLVSQTLVLPAGIYRLEGRSRGLNQPARAQPFWTLACSDGRELGRINVANSEQDGGRFSGNFSVPQDCGLQTLSLSARPTDDIMGVSGQIESVQLVPGGEN